MNLYNLDQSIEMYNTNKTEYHVVYGYSVLSIYQL